MDFSSISGEVNILGQPYKISIIKPEEDDALKRRQTKSYGYLNSAEKKIVLANREKEDWTEQDQSNALIWMKKTLRHEIVHAFLFESGLAHNAHVCGSWADNEEMVDWIAIQGVKLMKAWKEAGALE